MDELATTPIHPVPAGQEVPTGDKSYNLRRAIAAYEEALSVYEQAGAQMEWARTQANLGNAWREMPTGDKRDNICRAIAAYQAALTVYTRDANPIEWAGTQYCLGEAWQELPEAPAGHSEPDRVRRMPTRTIGIREFTPQEKANNEAFDKALDRYWNVYQGEMLAVVGDRLIDHGFPAEAVIDRAYLQADQEGIPRENVVFVPIPAEEAFR